MLTLIDACDEEHKRKFLMRIDHLKKIYSEMSDIYQESKGGGNIPLG